MKSFHRCLSTQVNINSVFALNSLVNIFPYFRTSPLNEKALSNEKVLLSDLSPESNGVIKPYFSPVVVNEMFALTA